LGVGGGRERERDWKNTEHVRYKVYDCDKRSIKMVGGFLFRWKLKFFILTFDTGKKKSQNGVICAEGNKRINEIKRVATAMCFVAWFVWNLSSAYENTCFCGRKEVKGHEGENVCG
jgi:hypothetical protein